MPRVRWLCQDVNMYDAFFDKVQTRQMIKNIPGVLVTGPMGIGKSSTVYYYVNDGLEGWIVDSLQSQM
jgi:type II secretory ATPase GspE/PulE/Tfp pilus assembly ATPase PilB-like protein